MRSSWPWAWLLSLSLLAGCVGGNGTHTAVGNSTPPPVLNSLTVTIDGGPAAASGAINRGYVTLKVCAPGSTTQCASIDHVLVDTGSWGLRLVGSVLASKAVSLVPETDSNGRTIEECVQFGAGQTWGDVARADLTLAGETAAAVPVQILDDAGTSAPPPSTCGANGTLINGVSAFNSNGILGVGVFAQDCGAACVSASTPLPIYYGCTAGQTGTCIAENLALDAQVTNPVYLFANDNNGVILDLPNLTDSNGDAQLAGSLIFGLGTQSDNPLPTTGVTVLGTNPSGDFSANYNGAAAVLPAWIDSGADSYLFDDASIATCASGAYIGYYCPANAPLALFAVNTGLGSNTATDTVQFAIDDPNSFVAGAAALGDLGGGKGSSTFVYGMPFFFGHKVYIGIDQRAAGAVTGPFFAY